MLPYKTFHPKDDRYKSTKLIHTTLHTLSLYSYFKEEMAEYLFQKRHS